MNKVTCQMIEIDGVQVRVQRTGKGALPESDIQALKEFVAYAKARAERKSKWIKSLVLEELCIM